MSVRSANFSPRMGMKHCGLAVIIVPDGFSFNVIVCVASANLMNMLTIIYIIIIDAQTCYP